MTYVPKPGVADCSNTPPPEEEAIILFPSLGTPLLLAPGQNKASIFIAAPSGMRGKAKGHTVREKAVDMYKLVDQHLRVAKITSKNEFQEPEGGTTTGTLFGEDKEYALAKQHITGWRVGEFKAGALISDRHGRPFATVAPAAAQLYDRVQDVYEIELDLNAKPFAALKAPGSLVSLAWMVRLSVDDKKLAGFEYGIQHAEAQDLAIARFFARQTGRNPHHFGKLQEFKLHEPCEKFKNHLPPPGDHFDTRLKSWHPVKRMGVAQLKLGHLSDVHVNVRHNALAHSEAKVLEDAANASWNQPVGTKVCNSFEALKSLFEKMASGENKADAVLLTGDLIDFNRNLNPQTFTKGPGKIGEQWKAFNLLGNIFDEKEGPRLYPRGLDDMLVFSLVREMYRKHQLPIIMTSGNHEAYQVPYGISARVEAGDTDNWAFKLGVLEATTVDGRAARQRQQENAKQSWPDGKLPNEARSAQKSLARLDAVERHRADLEAASAWSRGKANEGMSRDHNLTIYEACLAYGPTYGQALTGFNFSGEQFDWFYALFTPLADCVIAYGAESDDKAGAKTKQVIAALGWGTDENFMNVTGYLENGVDRQGAGILPRAVESFSSDQLTLLGQAQGYKAASKDKATLTVATHFTIVSFNEPQPYSNVSQTPNKMSFVPHNGPSGLAGLKAAFNHVNVGTCEKNVATYLEHFANVPGRRGKAAGVDWHLSGHSHRAGVYKVEWRLDAVGAVATRHIEVTSAKDPGIHGPQTVAPDTGTAFIVTSAGGPIGYQNLAGELSSWTGRPPAGTLLNALSGRITQVKTERCHLEGKHKGLGYNEKPRLCVALDYLHVMHGLPEKGNIAVPVSMFRQTEGFPREVSVIFSEQMEKLDCIEGVAVWVFEGGKDGAGDAVRKWQRLAPALLRASDRKKGMLKFSDDDVAILKRAVSAGAMERFPNASKLEKGKEFLRISQAFCEVALKKPASSKAPEDWAKDMQCTDPWVFPLSISIDSDTLSPKSYWLFGRPAGEKGEVPDWDFLALNFKDKGYIEAKEAITGKKPVGSVKV